MTPVYKPEQYDFIYERSSRNRILITAKTLFASFGYDNTSTAIIARNAGTSESQLMKHFGGKAGLLEAMFTEGWTRINAELSDCFDAPGDLNSRLSSIPGVVFLHLERDPELKTLILLEAHRMRDVAREHPEHSGYGRFLKLIDTVIERAQREGEFEGSALPLRSAIAGMIEGGVREQVLASRGDFAASYDSEEYRKLFTSFVRSMIAGSRTVGVMIPGQSARYHAHQ